MLSLQASAACIVRSVVRVLLGPQSLEFGASTDRGTRKGQIDAEPGRLPFEEVLLTNTAITQKGPLSLFEACFS